MICIISKFRSTEKGVKNHEKKRRKRREKGIEQE